MSAQSGGRGFASAAASSHLPLNAVEAANAAKRQLVSRKREVELVFAQPVAAKSLILAILAIVKPQQQPEAVQQLSNKKFLITFKHADAAEYFYRELAVQVRVSDQSPVCRWLGVERKLLRVSFLPCVVPNEELAKELSKFGRVVRITDEVYPDTPISIKTGTRLVELEMVSAVPNIVTVCGFSVPVTYKGVEIQCRRCLRHGHIKAECTALFCDRCRTFGHASTDCLAPCLKCRVADHHWKDCSVRNYAFVATATTITNDASTESEIIFAELKNGADENSSAGHNTEGVSTRGVSNSEASIESAGAAAAVELASVADDAAVDLGEGHVDATCKRAVAPADTNTDDVVASADGVRRELSKERTPTTEKTMDNQADEFHGVIVKENVNSNNLEWKMAITRSRRRQAAFTPGRSPLHKKSTSEHDIVN